MPSVVGTGFGARVHVPALRAAGFDVLALVGQDDEKTARRAARLEIPNACTSLDEALALPGRRRGDDRDAARHARRARDRGVRRRAAT